MCNILINRSALKHGITNSQIRAALANFIFEAPIDGDENKFLAVGFDENGKLLEIIYEYAEGDTLHVFHAMKCRKAVLELFK